MQLQTEPLTQSEAIADLKSFARKIEVEYFDGDVDGWLFKNFPDEFPNQLNKVEAQDVIY